MHVLHVLSFIVERVGYAIRPYSDSLIQYLPLMWEESAEHNMLRCAIVSTLVHLVKVRVLSLCYASFLFVSKMVSTMDFINETCSVIVLDKAVEALEGYYCFSSLSSQTLLFCFSVFVSCGRNYCHTIECDYRWVNTLIS